MKATLTNLEKKKLRRIRDVTWDLIEVDHDDYGDAYWHYKVLYTREGHCIYTEYWHQKPSTYDIIRVIIEAVLENEIEVEVILDEREQKQIEKIKIEEEL